MFLLNGMTINAYQKGVLMSKKGVKQRGDTEQFIINSLPTVIVGVVSMVVYLIL